MTKSLHMLVKINGRQAEKRKALSAKCMHCWKNMMMFYYLQNIYSSLVFFCRWRYTVVNAQQNSSPLPSSGQQLPWTMFQQCHLFPVADQSGSPFWNSHPQLWWLESLLPPAWSEQPRWGLKASKKSVTVPVAVYCINISVTVPSLYTWLFCQCALLHSQIYIYICQKQTKNININCCSDTLE